MAIGTHLIMAAAGNTQSGPWIGPTLMTGVTTSDNFTGMAVNSSGRYVAVGYDATPSAPNAISSYSNDGINWTAPTFMSGTAVNGFMRSVAVNSSGLFVAVGGTFIGNVNVSTPVYATSSDGINWSAPATMAGGTAKTMTSVVVNSAGLFVALGFDNTNKAIFSTSSNGTTWSAFTQIVSGSNIAQGVSGSAVNSSGRFVGIASNSGAPNANAGVFTTSTNGTAWSSMSLFNSSTALFAPRGIAVNSSGRFVVIGDNTGFPALGFFTTSTDGTTWTTPAAISSSVNFQPLSVSVDSSGVFVAVGPNGGNTNTLYSKSTDGVTWSTPAVLNPAGFASTMTVVRATSGGLFSSVGTQVGSGFRDCSAYYVPNPSVPGAPTIGTATVASATSATVTFTPGTGGGYPTTSYTVTSSPGGITATGTSSPITVTGLTTGVAYTFTVTATNAIGTSSASAASNSVTPQELWNSPALMNGSTAYARMMDVAVNSSGLFVSVGSNGTGYGMYATSSDGSTWITPTVMNVFVPVQFQSITVRPSNRFVAVGYDSSFRPIYSYSDNGSTWLQPAYIGGTTTEARMRGVASDSSGYCLAVGSRDTGGSPAPVFSVSTNGSSWSPVSNFNNFVIYGLMQAVAVNSSGLFVTVGYTSSNAPLFATYELVGGTTPTWTPTALMNGSTAYARMVDITVNSSGLFVAVGYNASRNPLYATSSDGYTWTTPAKMAGYNGYAQMNGVSVSSTGKFVAVGYDNGDNAVYSESADGQNWSTPSYFGGSAVSALMQKVTVNSSNKFVSVGYTFTGTKPMYAVSV